jgi:hypothetical protein
MINQEKNREINSDLDDQKKPRVYLFQSNGSNFILDIQTKGIVPF